MKERHKRFIIVVAVMMVMCGVTFGSLFLLKDDILFFFTPSDIFERGIDQTNDRVKVGGLVEVGSVVIDGEGNVIFSITDNKNVVNVRYSGVVPNLFREGKGVIADGVFKNAIFEAKEIMAKHDENYRPPDMMD